MAWKCCHFLVRPTGKRSNLKIAFLELAFLRVSVVDTSMGGGGGKSVAQRVVPLRALRPGFRHLRLRAPK